MTSVKIWPLLLLSFSLLSMGKDCPFPDLSGQIILSPESIQKNNFPDNSDASVVCTKGYEKESGSDSIICINGTWSAVELKCKKIDCGLPEASPHMNYSIPNGTLFGALIKPICERKYDLEGSSHRQCLVNGWNGHPKCVLITCDEPASIAHGTFSKPRENPEVDDVIEYSCDDNYTLVGNRFITCAYWTYSAGPPTCKVIITQTTASMTTNTATTTATVTATTHSNVIITQTTASMTTNTATTTATVTATTHSNGRSLEIIIACFAVLCICLVCICLVYRYSKQRGSYNTGEEKRTKGELLPYQNL